MADPIPKAVIRGDLPPAPVTMGTALPPEVVVLPTYRLYTGGQMALAAFLGGPLAGCWLLGRNYKRLRRPRAARLALAGGVAWTLALIGLALVLPYPGVASIVSVIAMRHLAVALQGHELHGHERNGGRRGSWGVAVGAGLTTLAIILALAFAGGVAYAVLATPPKVELANCEVYYEDGATEADAQTIGESLIALHALDGAGMASVKVDRTHERMTITFVVADRVLEDRRRIRNFHTLATTLSDHGFGGAPLDLALATDSWEVHTKLAWEDRPQRVAIGADHLWIRDGATEHQARAVGHVLVDRSIFDGSGLGATLARDGRVKLIFSVRAAALDAALEAELHALCDPVSNALGGTAVDVVVEQGDDTVKRLSWETRPKPN